MVEESCPVPRTFTLRGRCAEGWLTLSRAGLCGQFHFAVFDAEVGIVAGEEAPGVVEGLADADADVGGDFVGG